VLDRCNNASVKLTEDEYQLIQVWFGASQWAAIGPNNMSGTATLPSADSSRQQFAPDQRPYRDAALPPPDMRDIPLPPDFGFDREIESEPGAKSASQRFSFLKH
jgi:hypothetical protein